MRLGGRGQEKLFLEGEVLTHHHQISRQEERRALLAVAHTILQLVYEVLRTGQPYRDRQALALTGQQKDA